MLNKMLKIGRQVVSFVLILLLVLFLGLNAVSESSNCMIGWTSQPEIGHIERQMYLQTIGESGSLLFGIRSQPKATQLKVPEYRLSLEIPRASKQPSLTQRNYYFGIASQKIRNADQKFTASYTYVRIWLIGAFILLLLAISSIDKILAGVSMLRGTQVINPTDSEQEGSPNDR